MTCLDDAQPKKLIHLRKAPKSTPGYHVGRAVDPPYASAAGSSAGSVSGSGDQLAPCRGTARTMRGASGMDSVCEPIDGEIREPRALVMPAGARHAPVDPRPVALPV